MYEAPLQGGSEKAAYTKVLSKPLGASGKPHTEGTLGTLTHMHISVFSQKLWGGASQSVCGFHGIPIQGGGLKSPKRHQALIHTRHQVTFSADSSLVFEHVTWRKRLTKWFVAKIYWSNLATNLISLRKCNSVVKRKLWKAIETRCVCVCRDCFNHLIIGMEDPGYLQDFRQEVISFIYNCHLNVQDKKYLLFRANNAILSWKTRKLLCIL